MEQLLLVIEIALFSFLAFITVYTFLLSISGWLGYRSIVPTLKSKPDHFNKIAILIPAYKEDAVIEKVAIEMNLLDYPKSAYDVYVIADSMKASTLDKIRDKVNVIEVSFENSTKSNSLNFAFSVINKPYDIAIISDGDNILKRDFLKLINSAYQKGAMAIQGQRIAKNTNTEMAVLDAASEEINNHIYRRGLNGIGLSSAIIGSGMAFNYDLLKNLMLQNKAVGGFDKILQLELLDNKIKIVYLQNAITYDEKVENVKSFRNQRKRWISAQIKYLSKNYVKGWKRLFGGNLDYFNISVVCGVMPPRIILIGFLFLVSLTLLIIPGLSEIGAIYWLSLLGIYILALLICIPRLLIHTAFLKALLYLPVTFLNMLLALLKFKKADDKFIHTKHSNSSIDNVFHKSNSKRN